MSTNDKDPSKGRVMHIKESGKYEIALRTPSGIKDYSVSVIAHKGLRISRRDLLTIDSFLKIKTPSGMIHTVHYAGHKDIIENAAY